MRVLLFGMALGAAGMPLMPARAEVVAIELPQREVFPYTGFPVTLFHPVDLDGDSTDDFTFGYDCSGVGLRTERANRVVIRESPPPNIGGPVAKLDPEFLIASRVDGSGLAWISSDPRGGYVSPGEMAFASIVICLSTGCSSTWPPGPSQRGFIGVEFELDDGLHYGYLDISLSGSAPGAALS